ncbi:MAG TPA: class I SAM-dependent methyltransferase [Rariglobus sp.]|jgi:SAM-dependent methyltransferase|nr:class I SAM-dependent methyltransferase [Rariglobus sp.]
MTSREKTFDRLAHPYRLLEWTAFGPLLERARFRHLDHLRGRKRILLLGDGDGRVLARILALAPDANIDSVDLSGAMLAKAKSRLSPADRARVCFRHEDALQADYPAATYDAVTTFFFLDCFTDGQVSALVDRLKPSLTSDAMWLFADFAEPSRGLMRLRAKIWLWIMYAFFRWQTGLAARRLPDSENALTKAGLTRTVETSFQHGFVRSAVFAMTPADR